MLEGIPGRATDEESHRSSRPVQMAPLRTTEKRHRSFRWECQEKEGSFFQSRVETRETERQRVATGWRRSRVSLSKQATCWAIQILLGRNLR